MAMTMSEPQLNIIEVFASVQGETSFTGLPTTFIRLAACNLRCSWCDTTYSFGRGHPKTISELVSSAIDYNCRHICITGGEPLLQKPVHDLMSKLADLGHILTLETGGSLSIEAVDPRVHIILDIKCPGSDMSSKNHWPNLELIRAKDEIKFVISHEEDYQYAREICEKYNLFNKSAPHVLFSPVFGQLDAKLLVNWILRDRLPVRLNLQTHKFIWAPDTQGV